MTKPNQKDAVYIIDGLRTPIGHPFMGFKDMTAVQLAVCVIKEIVRRNKIGRDLIEEVVLGNVVSAGTGQNPARQAALLAKLSVRVPAYTVNSVCGAGLQAVVLAARSIACEDAGLVIAGGAESATHSPYFVRRTEAENYADGADPELNPVDCLIHDGLFCPITGRRMGELVETLARKYDITRDQQDDYAFESHRRACLAQQQRKFAKEIVPVLKSKKIVSKDEHPRPKLDRTWLEKLAPVFWTCGTVTAGNASLSCDGAAAVLLASGKIMKKYKLRPRARIRGYASIAVEPELTFESMAEAIRTSLKKCQLSLRDIDLFELSEAFAAQIIHTRDRLNIPSRKLNVFGGDIAFGHPLGAAGARILVTLTHALHDRKVNTGLACVGYGGGGAVAMIIEKT